MVPSVEAPKDFLKVLLESEFRVIIIIIIIIIYSCLYRDTPSPQVVVTSVSVVKS